jgi:hypothetical protein
LEIAPAKVLHGAVREQGFTSSPTPETQVRVACAEETEAVAPAMMPKHATNANARLMRLPLCTGKERLLHRDPKA